MKKLKVVFTKDSTHAISDYAVRQWYLNLLESGGTAYISTLSMFNELRQGVVLKEIEPFDVEFEGEQISVCSKGKMHPHVEGFFDHQARQMYTIMTGGKPLPTK